MKSNYLYIVDNYLFYYHQKESKIYRLKIKSGVLKDGKIVNPKSFKSELSNVMGKAKLLHLIMPEKITIINNDSYEEIDKELLSTSFEELNFKVIKFIKESKLLDLKKANYISVNNDYVVAYYYGLNKQSCYKLVPTDFFQSEYDLYTYLKDLFNENPVYLYGIAEIDVDKISSILNKKTYIIESPNTFIIKKLPHWTQTSNWLAINLNLFYD